MIAKISQNIKHIMKTFVIAGIDRNNASVTTLVVFCYFSLKVSVLKSSFVVFLSFCNLKYNKPLIKYIVAKNSLLNHQILIICLVIPI